MIRTRRVNLAGMDCMPSFIEAVVAGIRPGRVTSDLMAGMSPVIDVSQWIE